MTDYKHDFEGSTDGTQITTATFGSDTAFSVILPANAPTTNAWYFSTTGKISGTLGGRINITSSTAWRAYHTIASGTQVACRWGFTFNGAMPGAALVIASIIEGTGFAAVFHALVDISSHMNIQDFSGTKYTQTGTLAAGTAYYLEVQVDMGASTTTGTINAQLYTAADPSTLLINYASGATLNTRGTGSAIIRAQLGQNNTVTALDLTFDDVLYRTGTMTPIGAPATAVNATVTMGSALAATTAQAAPQVMNLTSPAYAATATDLGGGAGSWTSPANAQGTGDTTYATWTAP